MQRTKRTLARIATAGTLAAASITGGVLATAAPAAAASLSCVTGTGQWSSGNYYGWGSCTGTGTWRLRVSCSFGFTTHSPLVINVNSTELIRYGECYWGVSSVQVVQYS